MLTRKVIVLSAPCYYYFTAYEDQWIIWSRLILWRHYDVIFDSFKWLIGLSKWIQDAFIWRNTFQSQLVTYISVLIILWLINYDSLSMSHNELRNCCYESPSDFSIQKLIYGIIKSLLPFSRFLVQSAQCHLVRWWRHRKWLIITWPCVIFDDVIRTLFVLNCDTRYFFHFQVFTHHDSFIITVTFQWVIQVTIYDVIITSYWRHQITIFLSHKIRT